jgi:hypothetical protein
MSGTAVYAGICLFILLESALLYFLCRRDFEIWLRRVIQEEVSAVLGEDFAEREER